MEVNVSVNSAGDGVEAIVQLPRGTVASADDVSAEVLGDDMLVVESCGGQKLQVALPFPVDPDTGRVRFRRATGKLIFTASARTHPPFATTSPPPEPPGAAAATAAPSAPAAAYIGPLAAKGPGNNEGVNGGSMAGPDPAGACSGCQASLLPAAAPLSAATGCMVEPAGLHQLHHQQRQQREEEDPEVQPPGSISPGFNTVKPPTSNGTSNGTSGVHPTIGLLSPHGGTAGAAAAAACPQPAPSAAAARDPDQAAAPAPRTAASRPPHHAPSPPRSPAFHTSAATCNNDDAELYAEFYCNSPPAVAIPTSASSAAAAADVTAVHSADTSAASPTAAAAAAVAVPVAASHSSSPARGPGPTTPDAAGPAAISSHPGATPPLPHPPPRHLASPSPAPAGTASTNAEKVTAAFAPTGGTSSRDAGYSFTAPDVPPPPPLPPGLPPVAPAIDCRYLAVSNALRVSAHAGTAALAEAMGLLGSRRGSAAAERRKAAKVAEVLQQVADTLDAYGYAVLDNYIAEASVQGARSELRVMEPHYSPGLIWVGKEAEVGAQISVSDVRGDVVLWLDDQALNATAFVKEGVRRPCSFMQLQQLLADVDELVFEGLRSRLPHLAGLHRRSDAMMAVYPGKGTRFARHVDNTTLDGRRLTVVTYLNPGWREDMGGALRLFPARQGAAEVVDVQPLAGRVALFFSALVAHEVMPAFAPRHAVTLWYFDAGEHAAALTAAKVLPGATSRPSAQAAATALLRDLLADEAASGIPGTPEGCAALGTRVVALEAGAQTLLAAVLGLPGRGALVEAMRNLTPESLRMQREELRNMGLGAQHHAPDTSAHASGA